MRIMKRLAAVLLAVTAMAAAAVIPSTAAMATASAAKPVPGPVKITAQMRVTGIDAAVARAHGFIVRTNKAGKQYVVKSGTTAVRPDNIVGGDCGDSYMWLYAVGSHYTTAVTGFDLNTAAISYYWQIAVVDGAGTAYHSWGGGLAFDESWADTWTSWHSVTGYSWAQVTFGTALLWNGEVCTAEYPWDWAYVY
jgi:hypothetical protein